MEGILRFFLNAIKAILFSPFYIAYFIIVLLIGLINYLVGEVKVIFTGFKYGSKKENKYKKALDKKLKAQGGVNQWC